MTSLVQIIIDNVMDITPVFTNSGWAKIYNVEDIKPYNKKGIKF